MTACSKYETNAQGWMSMDASRHSFAPRTPGVRHSRGDGLAKAFRGTALIGMALLGAFSGCAALTNPVQNGIPARLLPEELLAESKSDLQPIPLTWLRRRPDDVYRLAKGDVLGVFIEGVLGGEEELPPIHFPDLADEPPSVGFPVPVDDKGEVTLPLIDPIDVGELTLEEAREAIVKAYTVDKEIIRVDEARVLVTLILPRRAEVMVVREDAPGRSFNANVNPFGRAAPIASPRGAGTGQVVELPATEADVLGVLTRTGGLPGPNAANEVIIQRGYGGPLHRLDRLGNACGPDGTGCHPQGIDADGPTGRDSHTAPLAL